MQLKIALVLNRVNSRAQFFNRGQHIKQDSELKFKIHFYTWSLYTGWNTVYIRSNDQSHHPQISENGKIQTMAVA